MNLCILIGNLTKDVEVRQVGSGSVSSFTIATSKKWKDKDGNAKEKTEFHNCSFWGKGGEVFAKYHSKGDKACVTGAVEYDSYEKDGVKRYITKINVEKFEFVKSGKSSASGESLPSRDINDDIDDSDTMPF